MKPVVYYKQHYYYSGQYNNCVTNKPKVLYSHLFVCVEVLLHVLTLLRHHQEIITRICYPLLDSLPIWIHISNF
jgi:hypothetical protein